MVVDDHAQSLEMLVQLLSLEGYQVSTAESGQRAMDVARDFKPDVALLDIGLPDMDGFALAKLFKADPQLCTTHLVALTGYGHSGDQGGMRAEGFDHYMVKPVDIDALLSVLAKLR